MEPTMTGLDERKAWDAVVARDAGVDGRFVYAVDSTRIYCRPTCPSRRPNPRNVHFYSSAADAERAGFRACKRCKPDKTDFITRTSAAISKVKRSIEVAVANGDSEGLDLASLAVSANVSPFHLQREFKKAVGLSPREYAERIRTERMKRRLRSGDTVMRATFEAGFNSASRGYASANARMGMSPARYAKGGAGIEIRFATAMTPIGTLLVARTERGICSVMLGETVQKLESELRHEFPKAKLSRGSDLDDIVTKIIMSIAGEVPIPASILDVRGSAFQWRVWNALRAIPRGETRTYGEIAKSIGAPGAARAVGSACANNRAALIIPCHRAVRADGTVGEYRWGAERKQALLDRENG
jgi:AraC family transcriptional regulator of adaptative response/methylated-DNA-[protein]-cysteine methyltransferase